MTAVRRILRGWQTEIGDAYVVSLVRAVFGVLLALSALRELDELRDRSVLRRRLSPAALTGGHGPESQRLRRDRRGAARFRTASRGWAIRSPSASGERDAGDLPAPLRSALVPQQPLRSFLAFVSACLRAVRSRFRFSRRRSSHPTIGWARCGRRGWRKCSSPSSTSRREGRSFSIRTGAAAW